MKVYLVVFRHQVGHQKETLSIDLHAMGLDQAEAKQIFLIALSDYLYEGLNYNKQVQLIQQEMTKEEYLNLLELKYGTSRVPTDERVSKYLVERLEHMDPNKDLLMSGNFYDVEEILRAFEEEEVTPYCEDEEDYEFNRPDILALAAELYGEPENKELLDEYINRRIEQVYA